MNNLLELVKKSRSYRRFYESEAISDDLLKSWINLTRYTPSARNMQSLRYLLVNKIDKNEHLFELLAWAGYLEDWKGPEIGERPVAYIVVLNDESLSENYYCDDGIVSQTILLGATESGFGGCIVAAFNRPKMRALLQIEDKYKIVHIIALGKPKEEVIIDEVDETQNIRYWRDEKNRHHVPKRSLNDLIL
ncbi:MAG: nitroreductase family protein [Bacteroidales bacterium]|nr:nitroreductase family protein [Bacteroidales bacterium]